MSSPDLQRVRDALGRIQGIADADGGRFLGEYGFNTLKDALYEARRGLDALEGRLGDDPKKEDTK